MTPKTKHASWRIAAALGALSMLTVGCARTPAPEGAAPQGPRVETLASYPHGAFLENLAVAEDGAIYVTSYFDRTLVALRDGAAAPFATLPAHPVGVLKTADGFIVTAHRTPFTDAPAVLSSNEILILDAAGAVVRTVAAPDARFLNGLVAIAPDRILIADSIAGLIWSFTPSSGALSPWLTDPLLSVDAATAPERPGANGLKLRDGALYISKSSRGAVYRLALTQDVAPDGALETVAAPGPVDDFAFATDGAIIAATHGAQLLRIAADGAVSPVLETGCDGCTSVAVVDDALIVLTTGNLLEGGDAPARVLRVTP